ncbi:MAG TPA: hypothetical protein DC006_08170 [Prevotellaceae bacterium]|nr:hypothetical protein [Prevotellaceae bacterium]HBE55831.1 hypothetical protein [Prevotellaceae bacterium]
MEHRNMKTKNILLAACMLAGGMLMAACMDGDWDAPKHENPPYGNNGIDTASAGLVTIADLKRMYPKYAQNYTVTEMKQEGRLKCYVTGNDIQGNLYNSIAVQDKNGDALIVSISESNLYGYLPVGQEIIIDTKGLYIGGYGQQPQIGQPYRKNATSDEYVSRMSSSLWASHVRILPTKKKDIEIPRYTAEQFADLDITQNCGKLMTITGVEIDGADGKLTWASSKNSSGTSVTLYFKGVPHSLMVYTSTYCDFANVVVPKGKLNLTGIWKRYGDKWELILRSEEDIEVAK